jgi:hypothetical protein
MCKTWHNQALQLIVKSAAPIVALLFTASELGRLDPKVTRDKKCQ